MLYFGREVDITEILEYMQPDSGSPVINVSDLVVWDTINLSISHFAEFLFFFGNITSF